MEIKQVTTLKIALKFLLSINSTNQDTIPPSTPVNLQAANISAEGFVISWDPSTDDQGVQGYNIYLNGNLQGFINGTSYQFIHLSQNSTYEVGVQAVDLSGNVSGTASINVTTLEIIDTPPSDIQVQVTQITDTEATAQWPASNDDGTVVRYHLYIDGAITMSSNVLTHQFTDLQPETTYDVYVIAEDNIGQLSNPMVTTFSTMENPDIYPPSIPGNLRAQDITHESATIMWNHSIDDSEILQYEIYFNDVHIASIVENQFHISGLVELTSYSIKVRARDVYNNASGFAQSEFMTLTEPDTEAPSTPSGLIITDITTSSGIASWQASIDNQGVMGYDVYLDGSWIGFTMETGYLISGLNNDTQYLFEVVAVDESNNSSDPAQVSFTTLAGTENDGEELILGSYFETGWEGWLDGGSDAYRYKGQYAPEGQWCIRLRDNSGSKSSMTTEPVDITNYSSVAIKFLYQPSSMETNEDFFVEYHDGTSWITIARFISGVNFSNNNIYETEVTISQSEHSFSPNAIFRIRCDASSNADKVYIDKVIIIGNPTQGIDVNPSSIKNNLVNSITNTPEDAIRLTVYPNPVTQYIYVEAEEKIEQVNFYSIEGRLIMSKSELDDFGIDVSNLKNGIYIVEVKSDGEIFHQKVIKR